MGTCIGPRALRLYEQALGRIMMQPPAGERFDLTGAFRVVDPPDGSTDSFDKLAQLFSPQS